MATKNLDNAERQKPAAQPQASTEQPDTKAQEEAAKRARDLEAFKAAEKRYEKARAEAAELDEQEAVLRKRLDEMQAQLDGLPYESADDAFIKLANAMAATRVRLEKLSGPCETARAMAVSTEAEMEKARVDVRIPVACDELLAAKRVIDEKISAFVSMLSNQVGPAIEKFHSELRAMSDAAGEIDHELSVIRVGHPSTHELSRLQVGHPVNRYAAWPLNFECHDHLEWAHKVQRYYIEKARSEAENARARANAPSPQQMRLGPDGKYYIPNQNWLRAEAQEKSGKYPVQFSGGFQK